MKDPYLKPVILGGMLIVILTIIFAPGIFIWAILGGYLSFNLAKKINKDSISLLECFLIGLFTGIIGGISLDLISAISFNSPESQKLLVDIIKTKWPSELPLPNIKEILPMVYALSSILILVISIIFSMIGSYVGLIISKKKHNHIKPDQQ